MTRTLISCCVALLLAPAVALADTRIDERHTLAAGGRIELSNVAGKVTVRGWDRNDVQLTGTLSDGLQLRQDGRQHLHAPRAIGVTPCIIDKDAELTRIAKQLEKMQQEVSRVAGKLANEGFMAKAPADVVVEIRERLAKTTSEIERITAALAALK